jgi:serine-type D-Ala-D-Ala carboxypeptidase (penicillin-binding protein 5/6)
MPIQRRAFLAACTAALAAAPAWAAPRRRPTATGAHDAPPGAPAPGGTPAQTPLGPVDTAARWAFVQDFATGAVLLDKAADEPVPPSSMTKLMTLYIVYERLATGRLKLTDTLPVSEKAWRMGGSKMFVQIGSQVLVEDLLRGVIVASGNDSCIVLAEGIAGSEEQFVELMNQKAAELGLKASQFANCTGWPDASQHMSLADIAAVATRIIRDYPQFYHYDNEKTFKYNGIEQQNRNPLVQKGLADGLKTGHTDAGGFGLVASAQRGGRRVVVVINGCTSMHQRAEESERLLEWAFREWENVRLFTAADTVEQAPVWLGTEKAVPLVAGKDLVITMPHGWRNSARITVGYESPIPAPVSRGAVLGHLKVGGQGVPDMEVPLLAGADVPRLGLPGRAAAVLSHYVLGS